MRSSPKAMIGTAVRSVRSQSPRPCAGEEKFQRHRPPASGTGGVRPIRKSQIMHTRQRAQRGSPAVFGVHRK